MQIITKVQSSSGIITMDPRKSLWRRGWKERERGTALSKPGMNEYKAVNLGVLKVPVE